MRSATQILHAHVGAPAVDGCVVHEPEPCAVCAGASTRGKLLDDFIGSNLRRVATMPAMTNQTPTPPRFVKTNSGAWGVAVAGPCDVCGTEPVYR